MFSSWDHKRKGHFDVAKKLIDKIGVDDAPVLIGERSEFTELFIESNYPTFC